MTKINNQNNAEIIKNIPQDLVEYFNKLSEELKADFNDWEDLSRLSACQGFTSEDIIRMTEMLKTNNILVEPFLVYYIDISCLVTILETGKYDSDSLFAYLQLCKTKQNLSEGQALKLLSRYIKTCKFINKEPDYFPVSLTDAEKKVNSLANIYIKETAKEEFNKNYDSYCEKGLTFQYEDKEFCLNFISDVSSLKERFKSLGSTHEPIISSYVFYYELIRKSDKALRSIVMKADSICIFFTGALSKKELDAENTFVESWFKRTSPVAKENSYYIFTK